MLSSHNWILSRTLLVETFLRDFIGYPFTTFSVCKWTLADHFYNGKGFLQALFRVWVCSRESLKELLSRANSCTSSSILKAAASRPNNVPSNLCRLSRHFLTCMASIMTTLVHKNISFPQPCIESLFSKNLPRDKSVHNTRDSIYRDGASEINRYWEQKTVRNACWCIFQEPQQPPKTMLRLKEWQSRSEKKQSFRA